MFTFCIYEINFLQVPLPTHILAKATEVERLVRQRVRQSRGDKRNMHNQDNKTEEGESTLVNMIDNLFCSFIVNNDANIAMLSHSV